MLDLVQTALLKKVQSNELASLYLLTYNAETTNPVNWAEHFQKEITPLNDHPDILKMVKGPKENEYKVDSDAIKEFLSFISTRPLQLSRKFIFLFDAQDLSVIVSNKLLKVFEELGPSYCLIMFAPRNASLLETVMSRAVKLTIPGPEDCLDQDASGEVFDFSGIESPQELMALLKESDDELLVEKKFIEHAIHQCLARADYRALDGLLLQLKEYEKRLAFNNSRLSRLSPFFS